MIVSKSQGDWRSKVLCSIYFAGAQCFANIDANVGAVVRKVKVYTLVFSADGRQWQNQADINSRVYCDCFGNSYTRPLVADVCVKCTM